MSERSKRSKYFDPMYEHEPTIRATLRTIERAGYLVSWLPPKEDGGEHVFTARSTENQNTHRYLVKGSDPIKALCELEHQLGFEDLD